MVPGGIDRPFFPELPILGSVRPRPVSIHEERTNVEAYVKKVDWSIARPSPEHCHDWTGLAGLMCSRILHDQGLQML